MDNLEGLHKARQKTKMTHRLVHIFPCRSPLLIHKLTFSQESVAHARQEVYGLTMETSTMMTPIIPPVLHERDLPGPLSLNRLARMGTVRVLDTSSGYWSEHANTLYGRALIVQALIPFPTAACALTALWVWMGGDFPTTLDVLSNSHYRTMRHGRRVRVFSRKIAKVHMTTIGDLSITSPQRTACDIASMFSGRPGPTTFVDQMVDFMQTYHFSPDDCIQILNENPCMATVPRAHAFFNTVRLYYSECKEERTPVDEAQNPAVALAH
ncbi:hypothetical protein G1C94_1324 [Bifidobacterium sp. DSM 109963]|uniref:Uncharacterized protein n=2 Tax=Bifidobacterium panos TaxID=2675321 RepID=A0ABX1SZW4_9BIFI|nr:hypothetical protein [Bifidobacterium sp. DSM 109963]